jgi:DNA-directed RNA polymerase subunit M/transcription elongation factor TFIIS
MGDILCPKCKSKETEFDDLVTNDAGKMIAKCHCNACNYKWDAPFSL